MRKLVLALMIMLAPIQARADNLTDAAACAARLMETEPVLPDLYIARQPSPEMCARATELGNVPAGRGPCRGMFMVWEGMTIVMAIDHFGVLVHPSLRRTI